MKQAYALQVLNPAPSMSQTKYVLPLCEYADAVLFARQEWAACGRSVSLTTEPGVHVWFRIAADGTETDHNKH